ncbi:MAG: hypothetical protein Kow0065_13670 [Methylomicrobium sp.]
MKKYFLMLGGLILVASSNAWAFRCGQWVVQTGDHITDVHEKCGEPDYIDKRWGMSGNRFRYPRGTLEIENYEEIAIEEWIYNFGPRRLKQQLIFENGILKTIRSLGYGN